MNGRIVIEQNPDPNWQQFYTSSDWYRYFDKNGEEVVEGDFVSIGQGEPQKLYRTVDGQLGVDATNPHWIEIGQAVECEYGIYPLTRDDVKDMEIVREHN